MHETGSSARTPSIGEYGSSSAVPSGGGALTPRGKGPVGRDRLCSKLATRVPSKRECRN
jgi:hypothetical protein